MSSAAMQASPPAAPPTAVLLAHGATGLLATFNAAGALGVADVRTAIYHGKFRRRGRSEGHRRDWKKAYVKLGPDEKMIEYAENL